MKMVHPHTDRKSQICRRSINSKTWHRTSKVAVATDKEINSTKPPKDFMLCSAGHTTSSDGASGMVHFLDAAPAARSITFIAE
jgi:hypothetical protein